VRVEVGSSNDQMTEITGGLKEGDYVVTRTVDTSAASAAATSQPTSRTGAGGSQSFMRSGAMMMGGGPGR